jgi:hypothetical protein
MWKLLANLTLTIVIGGISVSVFAEGIADTRMSAKKVKVIRTTNLVKGVVINPSKPTGLVVTTESGYVCSTENGLCVCSGDATSEDCQAMAKNICKRDKNGEVGLSCNGITCSCEWGSGPQVGGLGGTPAQTQGTQ